MIWKAYACENHLTQPKIYDLWAFYQIFEFDIVSYYVHKMLNIIVFCFVLFFFGKLDECAVVLVFWDPEKLSNYFDDVPNPFNVEYHKTMNNDKMNMNYLHQFLMRELIYIEVIMLMDMLCNYDPVSAITTKTI